MVAGCARKSLMRAGGCTRCGLGGAAAGGACATAKEIVIKIDVQIDIKVMSVSRMVILFFVEELTVVFVVLANELVHLRQIRTKRETARDGPGFFEHIR